MTPSLVVHIAAGAVSLIAGYIALYSRKGERLHRRAGMAFFYAMLLMCSLGALIAIVRGAAPALNVTASVLTAYLVITSLTTLREPNAASPYVEPGLMVIAFITATTSLVFAYQALASPDGMRRGMPGFPFIMFGVVGMIAAVSDVRILRYGRAVGRSRIVRHLWRMTFALFVAAMSFFLGQAKVIPKPIRIPGLLALPVLAVLITLIYWLWKMRVRRAPPTFKKAAEVSA